MYTFVLYCIVSGELLLHFFHYYSYEFPFSSHAITIHSSSTDILSKEEALKIATQCAPPNLPFKQQSFRLSSLTIQDPLELTHNIGKNIHPKALDSMKHNMSLARNTMVTLLHSETPRDGNSILSLFDDFIPAQPHLVKEKTSRILNFDRNTISNVFRKVPAFSELVGLDVGLTSNYVRGRLAIVVLKTLVSIIESEHGFICIPVTEEECTSSNSTPTTTPNHQLNTSISPLSTESVQSVKRQRSDHYHQDNGDSQDDDDVIGDKRVKLDDNEEGQNEACTSVTALIESHSLSPEGHGVYPGQVKCTVSENTWTHRRRFRRQEGMSQATPLDPPILIFTMSCVPIKAVPDDSLVSIKFTVHPHDEFVTEFQTFFAYFKKFVLHS